jgi:hypothetical protein
MNYLKRPFTRRVGPASDSDGVRQCPRWSFSDLGAVKTAVRFTCESRHKRLGDTGQLGARSGRSVSFPDTRSRIGTDLFSGQPRNPSLATTAARFTHDSGFSMPAAKVRASTILGAFEQAQTELVGKAVILTDGKAGTVENVWLDELHGLRISIRGHDGKWPVSTVKFAQN